jgi:hypothetical protein
VGVVSEYLNHYIFSPLKAGQWNNFFFSSWCSGFPKDHKVCDYVPRLRPFVFISEVASKINMDAEHSWNDTESENPKYLLGTKPVPLPFSHHKQHMDWSVLEFGTAY